MPTLKFKEYSLDIPNDVYLPSDDTYLMLDTLNKEIIKQNLFFKSALEIGSGNGFLSLFIYDNVSELYSVDLNPVVVDYLLNVKNKYNLKKQKIIYSDLFCALDENKKYDLILFNPPYVPSEKENLEKSDGIDLAVNGGEKGVEIITRFIDQLSKFLLKSGVCYLLISSLNNPLEIKQNLKKSNLSFEIVNSKKLFFEELFIVKIFFNN